MWMKQNWNESRKGGIHTLYFDFKPDCIKKCTCNKNFVIYVARSTNTDKLCKNWSAKYRRIERCVFYW